MLANKPINQINQKLRSHNSQSSTNLIIPELEENDNTSLSEIKLRSHNSQSPTNLITPELEENDDNTSLSEIKILLKSNLDSINKRHDELEQNFTASITKINNKLENIEESINTHINNNMTEIQSVKKMCVQNSQELTVFKEQKIATIDNALSNQQIEIEELKKQLDDQTNRNLRNTLIIKGVPQETSEISWDDTIKVLSTTLNKHCNRLSVDYIEESIERAHRGKPYQNDDTNQHHAYQTHSAIFVKFHSWQDADRILKCVISENKSKKNKGGKELRIMQMFSPALTARRNEALKLRKQLLLEGENKEYKLSYPAKLMERNKGSQQQFKLSQEF